MEVPAEQPQDTEGEVELEEPQEIDIATYSVAVVPPRNSLVVLNEKEKLLGSIDLRALVVDLGRVGSFIRIAYNGVGAAGPKYTENQIAIQRVGYDITKLCDKSAVTVSKFMSASKTIINDLQASYGFLLEGLETLAVDTVANIKTVSAGMNRAAVELQGDFANQAIKVEKLLETTQRSKAKEKSEVERCRKERKKLEEKRQRAYEKAEEAIKEADEEERKRKEYELKEDENISQFADQNLMPVFINALTTMVGVGPLFKDFRGQAKEYKKKKLAAAKAAKAAKQEKSKHLDDMASFAAKLCGCDAEANLADAAVDALHEASRALRHLSAVMMKAALFWQQMEQHCEGLADDAMIKLVESSMKVPGADRLQIWTGDTFKRRALQFYAGWVALHSVCDSYMDKIKLTQKELYEYIQENPTYEESKDNVQKMAQDFLKGIEKAKMALSNEKVADEEKIRQLTKECNDDSQETNEGSKDE